MLKDKNAALTMKRLFLLLFVSVMTLADVADAGQEDVLYRKAFRAARSGNSDFAFMYYNALSRDYPNSEYRHDFLFAKGEYYFWMPNYQEARGMFETLLNEFPQMQGRLIVLAYLYRIAQIQKDDVRSEQIKKEIVNSRQVGLVFKEFKENQYLSPMRYAYRVVFHIDKVEFYREGGLFAEVSY